MQLGDLVADRFRIERKVGAGGIGIVYQASDSLTGERVALKVLFGGDELEPARFEREARVLATLDHPAIVRYVGHGLSAEGEPYLAMEWLDGETLGQRLSRQPFTLAESLRLALRLAEALEVLHARELVHRDIKPGNIMLAGSAIERAKLLDFGLARAVRSTHAITRTGAMLGTPSYMAPEQARSAAHIDGRADLHALGAVLYATIAGRPPFIGGDAVAIVLKLLLEEPPALGEVAPDVPPEVERLVMRLLAKAPEGRPPNARAVIVELGELLASLAGEGPASKAPSATEVLTTTERRLMCLVLARLASFGDPDTTRSDAALAAHARFIHAVLEPFHVRLELVGDDLGIVVVLGKPEAHDLARVAARCALALRGALPESHIVVVSGGDVVGYGPPTGNLVERGVTLLAQIEAAAPEGIWLDAATAGLVASEFEVRDASPAPELVGERDLRSGVRTLLGKPIPCFGRERELTTLIAFFEECSAESVARGVLLMAPAGFGKSRVRYELLQLLEARDDPPEIWLARSDPMSAGSAFGLLGQVIRRTANVHDGEPVAAQCEALRARVARHVEAAEVDRVAEFLGEITRVQFPAAPGSALYAARQSPQLMHDQTRRAWLDFLAAECRSRTVLVVLEDLQWSDGPTQSYLAAALDALSDRPLMLLALARPEVHVAFPGGLATTRLHEIRLAQLTRRASERLVRAALGESVPTELVETIVERAQGNAFYLEELVRAVVERKSAELPDSVLATVHARLDALEPEARQILRAASVFGQAFWQEGVHALLGADRDAVEVGEWLDHLCQRELVSRRSESRFPDQRELVFRHGLLREGAYASLTERDRQVGHRLAGRWLEGVAESDAGVLGEHFERGAEYALASSYYEAAARAALAGSDLAAALALADRGIACDRGHDAERVGRLWALKSAAQQWRGENAEAERSGGEALLALEVGSAAWCGAAQQVLAAAGRLGHYAELCALAERLLAIDPSPEARRAHAFALTQAGVQALNAGRLELVERLLARFPDPAEVEGLDPMLAGAIDRVHASAAGRAGDLAECLSRTAAAVARLDAAGDVRNATLQRVNLGYAEHLLGCYAESERHLREALATSLGLGLSNAAAMANNNLGLALARQGKLDEALAVERAAVDAFVSFGDRRMEAGSRAYLAVVLLEAGDAAGAEREAREAARLTESLPQMRGFALGVLAEAALLQGRADAALDAAVEAKALLDGDGVEEGELMLRNAHVAVLDAVGRRAEADEAARAAKERVLELAAKLSDPALCRRFVEDVPENARALRRGGS